MCLATLLLYCCTRICRECAIPVFALLNDTIGHHTLVPQLTLPTDKRGRIRGGILELDRAREREGEESGRNLTALNPINPLKALKALKHAATLAVRWSLSQTVPQQPLVTNRTPHTSPYFSERATASSHTSGAATSPFVSVPVHPSPPPSQR